MFFRMIKQSFLRNKKQKFLAIVTIFLSSGLICALLNTSINIGDKMSNELKSYGANISVIPKSDALSFEIGGVDYSPLKGKVFLKEKDLPRIKDIFWRNNVLGFAPFLDGFVNFHDKMDSFFRDQNSSKTTSFSHENQNIKLIGTFFDKNVPIPDEDDYKTGVKDVLKYWKIDGKMPIDDTNEALLGATLAQKLNKTIGENIDISYENKNESFKIVGILHSGESFDDGLIVSLSKAQMIFDRIGDVARVEVSALIVPEDDLSRKSRRNPDALDSLEYDNWYCTAYVSSIAFQIEENMPNAAVKPIWQVAQSEGVIIQKIQLLMIVVTIATLFASSLGISSLMSATIMDRSKEIGLIKALGANNFDVYLIFLCEAIVVGIIGGMLGFVLGSALSQIISYGIFGSFVAIKFIVLPIILFISVSISLLGSIIPSKMIARLLPADVLYGRK